MSSSVGPVSRLDARSKATGATRYTADQPGDDAVHAALVRSPFPCAEIMAVSTGEAATAAGVVAVFTAEDLPAALSGRRVRDMPLLARDKTRFTGEAVAVVLAESRRAAEAAVALVDVDYGELPAVLTAAAALSPGAPLVHQAAWSYDGAVVHPGGPPNLQSELTEGSLLDVEAALEQARHVVDRTYRTPSGHQGYLEPQAWLAVPAPSGTVHLWATNKAPYRLRDQIAKCLDMDVSTIEVEPVALGGDFGGKGSVGEASLCVALALAIRRPVRLVLRSGEDLTATDARHPATLHVRLGCQEDGTLVGLALDAVLDGGAYASAKPVPTVNLHGLAECALAYRLPHYSVRSRIAYTNTVPKGHMRAPGAPQAVFAIESALDELATTAGIDPVELRQRNLLRNGDGDAYGHIWPEARGAQTLAAAAGTLPARQAPPGWASGTGVAVYARATAAPAITSLRLEQSEDGRFEVQVPIPETGTGSHSVVRERLAAGLGIDPALVAVSQASTGSLPFDPGVGASRVTIGMTAAVEQLVAAWLARDGPGPVTVESPAGSDDAALSFCAQLARAAIDPETGEVRLLELVTAVDVASIVRPQAHQLQIDGGAVMGLGFALFEDLLEGDGQVWASNLGEFKVPAPEDVPVLTTLLVEGGAGVGPGNLKAIGELTNPAVAPAIANAVSQASGARIRELPITAEKVYWSWQGGGR